MNSIETTGAKKEFTANISSVDDQSYFKHFEHSLEAFIISAPDGRVINANLAAARMFGHQSVDEMLGNLYLNYFARQEQRDAVIMELNLNGFIRNYEVELIRQDAGNSRFNASVSSIMIKDSHGRLIRYETLLSDISERKKLEQHLVESQNYLDAIYQNTNIGLAIGDLDGNFVNINPALIHLLGYNLEELRQLTLSGITFPDDWPKDRALFQELLEGRRSQYQIEKRYLHKNGSLIWGLASVTLIKDKEGKPQFTIGTLEDITERKTITQELISSRDEITNLVAHIEKIREMERIKIAADLHDDLGQQLLALNMDLSWLKTNLSNADREITGKLTSMSAILLNTIETVQFISTELRPGILDDFGLSAAIEWHLEEVRKRTGIHYELSLPPDDFDISADLSILIFRVVQEALTNITRHAVATIVHIVLKQENRTLYLVIRDNGRGITKAEIKNPRSFGIIGMKQRVKSYGGTFTIFGRNRMGTTIEITLPEKITQ